MYTHKKSLGQHFLKDENVIKRIITVLKEDAFNKLLEVGPGAGALTKYLMDMPGVELKAVELDEEKVIYLSKKYPSLKDKLI
ncbi:MAG TPA: rRNA adenine N-6-methyltransferase family protein, partial [Ferruginibacter sp.]|nr:rRNA adenine N-6-methyltransferase family protein [Ferruginibacter sp.]